MPNMPAPFSLPGHPATNTAGGWIARAALALLLAGAARPAVAQEAPEAPNGTPTATADSSPHRSPLVARRDAVTVGASLAAAGALFSVDERIARWSQRPALQQSRSLGRAADVFNFVGDPGVAVLGGIAYATGLVTRRRAMADVGLHTTAAVVVAGAVTGVIKAAAGRARPYVTADSDAHDFAFGRGLRRGNAYQSFPSGHATAAFAFAAALAEEGRHRWPSANRVTAPLGYAGASLVALARVYRDKHWASDVALGAGVGLAAGRALVRYQHDRPNNAADGRLLPPRTVSLGVLPLPGGVAGSITF